MSNQIESSPHEGAVSQPPEGQLAERGLTTIEYAIGLVAAATAALVLMRVFNDNVFFQTLFEWVLNIFRNLVGTL